MVGTITLVICRNCFSQKESMNPEVVAGFDVSGNVYVKRYHNGVTKITGNDFQVSCGRCNTPLLMTERRQDEITHQWIKWVHRQSFNGTAETVGTFSDTN